MDAERSRRVEESKDEHSEINVQRRETYDRLVTVQEDLLKTIQGMKVREGDEGGEGQREGREGPGGRVLHYGNLVHFMTYVYVTSVLETRKATPFPPTNYIS